FRSCPVCNGLGTINEINLKKIISNNELSIKAGGIEPIGEQKSTWIFKQLEIIAQRYEFKLTDPIKDIPAEALDIILNGGKESFSVASKILGITKDYKIDFEGISNFIKNQFNDAPTAAIKRWAGDFMDEIVCTECHGSRLRKESLYFKVGERNIDDLATMDLDQLSDWFGGLHENLSSKQQVIAGEVVKEISSRLSFLLDVGLNYLTLNRSSKALSGGEAQRIRLATQIGSQLVGVLYMLDEPSIGLHQRDNEKLIASLKNLRDIGNSVLVVEHDKEMIREADHVLDIGPKAGKYGGEILWQGSPDELAKADTITADYLNGRKKIEVPTERRKGNDKKIVLKGASGNNLKNVNLEIPLGKLVVVTGISGSGKSSLINGTLYPILNQHFYRSIQEPLPYKKIEGIDNIDKIVDVDQTPIGRTPRSNPATYTGMFSVIRNLFAEHPESKIRGYKPGSFSFNVKGGRCETCQGGGLKVIEMNFLPDVYVHCETCNGKRFNRETLEVRYKGKSISDVLEMTIDEAVQFFQPIPKIHSKVKTLQDVGLGYITLGQQSTTLSGGEARRIKLATELSKRQTGNTLYILDEPTTGLHFEDVKILMDAINKLIDLGNSFIIIEHNMDVIKLADHIIDIGPEGGK